MWLVWFLACVAGAVAVANAETWEQLATTLLIVLVVLAVLGMAPGGLR